MRNILLVLALTAGHAFAADESGIRLKDGPGREIVEGNCVMCHSLDYIQMNSPFLDRKGWEAEVNKMIKTMGAPIGEEDARRIVDYLASRYGK
ncbi:MAG TPA: cytochrome c [Burkholderiales bacterium]|nr:cytochrome c [Burkholderiales bacterium]